MSSDPYAYRQGVIRPAECLREGKALLGDQFWLFVGIAVVAILIGSAVPFGILMGAMLCGLYKCLLAKERGETVTFELLFKGFDHFVEGLIANLIQLGVTLAAIAPLIIIGFVLVAGLGSFAEQGSESVPVGLIIGMVVMYGAILVVALLVTSLFLFSFPLIVDRGLSGLEAIKLSARAVKDNLQGVIGLVLLSALLGLVAVILCYLPVFLVLPVIFAGNLVAYRRVFPALETAGA